MCITMIYWSLICLLSTRSGHNGYVLELFNPDSAQQSTSADTDPDGNRQGFPGWFFSRAFWPPSHPVHRSGGFGTSPLHFPRSTSSSPLHFRKCLHFWVSYRRSLYGNEFFNDLHILILVAGPVLWWDRISWNFSKYLIFSNSKY